MVDIQNSENFFLWEQEPQKKSLSLKKRSDYYGFGLVMPGRSSNSANPNDRYKYIGEELDDEAGINLMNLNARMYDPTIARFMQVDPLFDHPNQIGLSPYNYSWNNPINLSDPTGECPDACIVEGGAAVTAGVIATGALIGYAVAYAASEDVRNAHNSFAAGVSETVTSTLSDAWNGVKNMFASDSDAAPAVPITGDAVDQVSEKSEESMTLYRGVGKEHPGFELATQGIAVPRGGNASSEQHSAGNTASIFTSWSMSRGVANGFAGENGVVLSKQFKPSQMVIPNTEFPNEHEILVPGVVRGANVTKRGGN